MRIGGQPECQTPPAIVFGRQARDFPSAVPFQLPTASMGRGQSDMSTVESTQPVQASVRTPAPPKVSVVIPCLNEAENIAEVVRRARTALEASGIPGEVVVADNDSEDGSAELAAQAGARVVDEPRRGYGSAYLAGFEAARGDYIVMIDADLTYDFEEILRFVHELDDGAQFVMGN